MPDPLSRLLAGLFGAVGSVTVSGREHIPPAGEPLIVVANHVGFLDPLLMRLVLDRDLAYAIDPAISELWWVKPVTRFAAIHRVEPARPFALRGFMRAVAAGATGVIFPESRLTLTRGLMKFYGGAAFAAARTGATILPIHIGGMDDTPFTRLSAAQAPRRVRARLTVTIGAPFRPGGERGQAARARQTREIMRRIAELGACAPAADITARAWRDAALARHAGGHVLIDDADQRRHTARSVVGGAIPRGAEALAVWLASDAPAAHAAADAARFADAFELVASDRVMVALPFERPIGRAAAMAALARGAQLVVPPQEATRRALLEHIYIRNPSLLVIDKAQLTALFEVADRYDFRSLRAAIIPDAQPSAAMRLRAAELFGLRLLDVHAVDAHAVATANTAREGRAGTFGVILPGLPADVASGLAIDADGFVVGSAAGAARRAA